MTEENLVISDNVDNGDLLVRAKIQELKRLLPKKQRIKKKLPEYITQDEFRRLMQVTKNKTHKLAFALGFLSGMRISEIIKLRKEDIDFKAKKILIRASKFGRDRVVPMPKNVPTEYFNVIPLMPNNYKNVPSGSKTLQEIFNKRRDEAKINPKLHFHSLRHGFATHAMNSGIPLNQIQLLLGHENLKSTSVYAHANPQEALGNYEELF